jgi:carboxypeptidase PM20D1
MFYLSSSYLRLLNILMLFFCMLHTEMAAQLSSNYCVSNLDHSNDPRPFFPSHIKLGEIEFAIPESADLLRQYIRYPSLSGSEANAVNYFQNLCKEKGLYIFEMNSKDGSRNFIASVFPLSSGKPNYIFLNHADVVDVPAAGDWKYPPYDGVIAEGQVWGRGAYDNKGAAIVQLMAILRMAERARSENWPVNFSLLCMSGEEVFSPGGAGFVAENHIETLNAAAFFGEGPAGLQGVVPRKSEEKVFSVALAHKRALWLKLRLAYESSGHGSTPPLHYPNKDMVSAVNRVLKSKEKLQFNELNTTILHLLGDMEGGTKGFFLKNIHLMTPVARAIIRKNPLYLSFFANTISLTRIQNEGLSHNSIPNEVVALLDCRLLPGIKTEDFINKIKRQLKNKNITVEVVLETPDALPTKPDVFLYGSIEKSIHSVYSDAVVAPMMLQATIDSNYFREKGYPVYCFVPILLTPQILRTVHARNERVPIVALENGIQITEELIKRIGERAVLVSRPIKFD